MKRTIQQALTTGGSIAWWLAAIALLELVFAMRLHSWGFAFAALLTHGQCGYVEGIAQGRGRTPWREATIASVLAFFYALFGCGWWLATTIGP